MRILLILSALLFLSPAYACDVYKHKDKVVNYDGGSLYFSADKSTQEILLVSGGLGIPYRVSVKSDEEFTIEPVQVYDKNSTERGGTMWAILINDILYRPYCP